MEVYLPHSVGTRDLPSLYSVCGQVLQAAVDDAEIILDAHRVEFIDPHGLAVLAALLTPLADRRISMPWLSTNLAGYMDRMDFFKHCDIEDVEIPPWNRYEHPEKLVELCCITDSGDTESVANRLADAITGNLTTANPCAPYDPNTGKNEYDRYRHPIWYSLSELLENSVTHARKYGCSRASVWVAAQFYEANGEVKLSVVDNGCGMLRTLAGHPKMDEHTHLAAIRTAIMPKVSCNRDGHEADHGNQGVGLTTTMLIAGAARWRLLIASGNAQLETRHKDGHKMHNNGAWNGVAIAFSCQRKALPSVNPGSLLPAESAKIPINFTE